jgi:hemerythrin-like metal-binding protein
VAAGANAASPHHEAGDRVLQATADVLRSCCREVDTAARIGGDEFALILPGVSDPNGAALVASRLILALAEPIAVDGNSCCVGISVGIALYPRDGETIETLFGSADAAMYASKAAGRNCSSFADPGISEGKTSGLNFIVWSDLHEVGIGATDAQHRKLAAMIGKVGAEFAAGQEVTTLRASLEELLAFAQVHFAAEEALMDRFAIADRATHKQAHQRMLQDLQSLLNGPGESSMMLTMSFLHEWLLRHVDSADRELARQLLAKGYTDSGHSGALPLRASS